MIHLFPFLAFGILGLVAVTRKKTLASTRSTQLSSSRSINIHKVVLSAISFFVGMQFKGLFRPRVSNVNSYAGWAPDDSGISKPRSRRGRRRQRKSRSLRQVKSVVVDVPASQANSRQIVESDDSIPKVLVQSYVMFQRYRQKCMTTSRNLLPDGSI